MSATRRGINFILMKYNVDTILIMPEYDALVRDLEALVVDAQQKGYLLGERSEHKYPRGEGG